jgi:hypothetical protein
MQSTPPLEYGWTLQIMQADKSTFSTTSFLLTGFNPGAIKNMAQGAVS